MGKLSADLTVRNLHPRENLFASGNLAALNAAISCFADGASNVMVSVSNAYVGTIVVEGRIDGANWDLIALKPVNGGGLYVVSLASAAIGRWSGSCAKFTEVRARMASFTSGSASVLLMVDNGISDIIATPAADQFHAESIGTAGAALTLTIPAPGAGLYQFISRIEILRFPTAALTAAAAPIAVTSTNLPGSRTFRLSADAAAQGVIASAIFEGSKPLRASTVNTAVTIVCPLTTGVLWFASADYNNLPEG